MKYVLLFCMLLATGLVHAEGECPPGMFPTNPAGAQGPVGCAPIPGYDQQQQQAQPQQPAPPPPPHWATRWGAIATDEPKGILGTASNASSRDEAEHTALTDCRAKGGSPCKLENSYGNACAALVVSDKGYNVGSYLTLDEATRVGMKICKDAGNSNCHVYYTACSLPVRIQ